MAGAGDLAKLVPGFEFLQGLMQNAGASLPGLSQWIAPTLSPEELDKRIQELKTVQFWLEQNARLLTTTIQALEVQRMTLSTLQSMNLPMADLRDALKIDLPSVFAAAAPSASPPLAPPPPPSAPPPAAAPEPTAAAEPEPGATKPGVVDPMQWWGALTQQFASLAAQAVKDTAADTARAMAAAAPARSRAAKPGPISSPSPGSGPKARAKATPGAKSSAKPAAPAAKAGAARRRAG